ncbi:MAG: NADH-dependent phenylglyoxylate dehydrogenase subunit gamma [candidate division TA06 bacterium ADurb.Bin417]|uniref:NADH-dependent phenylglyoxylate dehydrogenase subunit gamma n=1 Tax=candidate division TA06 bacterium ADurb.Bin417 TaxID=1852828 RepID=A0A1V5MJJ9_UNCT6|nr:MAG: NADH-dependent phenylglyoxylate dehydrogenase subunit gamma [candidate division TA06 bacterium ADurb.Bin417]
MITEMRIHARAGQGAITTAALMGTAIFVEGRYAYAFPSFGAARMGAPMNAFVRISNQPIRLRSQIYRPDYVIVADPTLCRSVDVLAGVKEKAVVIINAEKPLNLTPPSGGVKICYVPANEIARRHIGRPLANTALLGAFAAASGAVKLESLEEVIRRRFPEDLANKNIASLKEGWEVACR